ncbi:MAG: O-antigen ligase family protein [Candidatus Omnitrophica bacterium]|nr:O-antigen ligase family protein [Candidatus Omnitrophota bacterium]
MINACIAVIVLRLFLPTLIKFRCGYITNELSGLIVAIVILMLGLVFIFRKWQRNEAFVQSGFEWPIVVLLAACGLSLFHSAYFFGSQLFVIGILSYAFYFYILVDVLREEQAACRYLLSLGTCCLVVGVWSIGEYGLPISSTLHWADQWIPKVYSYRRVASVFDSPNLLAGFYMMALPVLGAILVLSDKLWKKWASAAAIILSLAGFLMTLSFLCTVNFFVTTVILAPVIMKEWFKKSFGKLFYSAVMLGMGLMVGAVFWIRKDCSSGARVEYLQAAWLILKDHWCWGTGIDTFRFVSPQYAHGYSYSGYVHNSYVQIWAEIGVLGLIAVLSWIGLFVTTALKGLQSIQEKRQRILWVALIWALSAFYVDNLTNFSLLSPDMAIFGWVALAGFCTLAGSTKEVPIKAQGSRTLGLFLGLLAGLLLLKCLVLAASFLDFQKAMVALDNREYPRSYELFEQAKQLEPSNQNTYAEQGLLDMRVYELTGQMQFLSQAESKLQEASAYSPYYYPNTLLLCKIAKAEGNRPKMKQYYQRLLKLCPAGQAFFEQELLLSQNKK